MRVLGIDVETTGLDTKEDRIIEIGAVVWDTDYKVPLEMFSEFVLPPPEKLPLQPIITKLTGIREEWLQQFGAGLPYVFNHLESLMKIHKVEYVVAHNGENYDKPLILAELERAANPVNTVDFSKHLLTQLPWIDTRFDLPYEEEPGSRKLNHLALDHGFINPFKHRALFDVLTMLKLTEDFDFEKIIEQSKIPWCVMRALVSFEDKDKAKELRYSWEQIGDRKFPKWWVKKVKENRVEEEALAAAAKNFKAVRIE